MAIAAALIPPIATSGMALAIGNLWLSVGAFLLFLTNVVFIVLGTSMVFWSIGINTRPQKSSKSQKPYLWTRYWFAAFVILSTILATAIQFVRPDMEQETGEDNKPVETQVQAQGSLSPWEGRTRSSLRDSIIKRASPFSIAANQQLPSLEQFTLPGGRPPTLPKGG